MDEKVMNQLKDYLTPATSSDPWPWLTTQSQYDYMADRINGESISDSQLSESYTLESGDGIMSQIEKKSPITEGNLNNIYTKPDILDFLEASNSEPDPPTNIYKPRGRKPVMNRPSKWGILVNNTTHKTVKQRPKDYYSLEECLDAFKELVAKDIGDIYLTGSVALALQGKINRTKFKDLDILVIGKLELDDEIDPFSRSSYTLNPDEKPAGYIFNNIVIDFFTKKDVNFVEVDGIKCSDYKDIIQAKINMILPSMKDYDYLIKNHINITIT